VITARAFAGKHYAVYGLARSGLATVEALLASGAKVTAWDAKEEARANAPSGTQIANLDEIDLTQFDSLVVTPGLPLNRHPIAQRARAAGVEIIGDIELFARARPELPPHKVVGITGTNGKSTTTALVHHILQTAGVPSAMGGNIGLPILAQEPLPTSGVYVLELSSYQLDLTQSLDCDVVVLLNITPDHLDRYESFEAYAASKERLLTMTCGSIVRGRDVSLDQSHWPALQGPHNAQNVAAAIETCEVLGLGEGEIEEGLRSYPGLPHRMERIREKDGVTSTTARRPTRPRPRRRSPRSNASAGFAAGSPRPTISTSARRTSAMSPRPIPLAKRANCSLRSCRRT
jgi:UDP-N-acetylmuramoylalanine--D-glutamate ligase